MRTSAKGRAFIERHEGVVLKAYRDIVGVWTIGAGLTAASGVVVPRAGMTITAEEASVLLHQALLRNYEPAVVEAMARMAAVYQHEFDAAVSFHFNTGAIGRASWVTAWLSGDMALAVAALRLWNKARGRVVTGLVRRRDEEARLLRVGDYGGGTPERPAVGATHAAIAAPLTAAEVPALRAALIQLGYGGEPRAEYLDLTAVRAFQAAHGLTVDGIVGRATASAIQRALDARAKGGLALAATGGSGAAAVAIDVPDLAGIPGIEAFPALAAVLWGGASGLRLSRRDCARLRQTPAARRGVPEELLMLGWIDRLSLRTLILSAVVVGLLVGTLAAIAQTAPQCAPWPTMASELAAKYGEVVLFEGAPAPPAPGIVITAKPDGTTWTALTIGRSGMACIKGFGGRWRAGAAATAPGIDD